MTYLVSEILLVISSSPVCHRSHTSASSFHYDVLPLQRQSPLYPICPVIIEIQPPLSKPCTKMRKSACQEGVYVLGGSGSTGFRTAASTTIFIISLHCTVESTL